MIRDPIVEEVRSIRERLAAKFNFESSRMVADARARQELSSIRRIELPHQPQPRGHTPETDLDEASKPLMKSSASGEKQIVDF